MKIQYNCDSIKQNIDHLCNSTMNSSQVTVSKCVVTKTYVSRLVGLTDLRIYVASTSRAITLPNTNPPIRAYDVDYVSAFEELKELYLFCYERNHVINISPKIQNLVGLNTLKISNRYWIQDFQPDFSSLMFLSGLKILNLAENFVATSGLKWICGLYFLESLILSECKIRTLPDEFCNLQNLSRLDLSRNRLQCDNLNSALRCSTNMTSLNLGGCGLVYIPIVIAQMSKLTYLNLSYNSLSQHFVNVDDILPKLTKLTTLILKDNNLPKFPLQICFLPKLECLDISDCKLNDLPDELYGVKSLIGLNISGNKLKRVSPLIGQLKNLIKLKIWGDSYDSYSDNIDIPHAELSELGVFY